MSGVASVCASTVPRPVQQQNERVADMIGERMFRVLKHLKMTVVALGSFALAAYGVQEGADPTVTIPLALVVGGSAIVDWSELQAFEVRRTEDTDE